MEINNYIEIQGTVVSNFEFSHEVFGEKFYTFKLSSLRDSGTADELPVTVSERLIDINMNLADSKIALRGQVRTYNDNSGNKSKLIVSIFLREIIDLQERDFNKVELVGYICRQPIYRKTPLGREITDLLLAVNRPYDKSDYIPSIAWGRNANFVSGLNTGSCLNVKGRLQSREYLKEEETRIAYELSISTLEEIEEVKAQ